MRTFILIVLFIFGIYLYFNLEQSSKDNITRVTLDIPNKVQYVTNSVTKGGVFTFNWNYKQE